MMPANDTLRSYDQVFYVHRAEEFATLGESRRVQRSRMPLYPWLLSFFHQDGKTEDELFPHYKAVNVAISIFALLGILAVARFGLGTALAVPLTLATAFTFIVFKAVLIQPEVLFYLFYFTAFVLMVRCLWRPGVRLAAGVGAMTGLTHLTKGSVLPMLCAFLAVAGAGAAVSAWWRNRRTSIEPTGADEARPAFHGWQVPASTVAGFLAVTAPLLWNSARVFGNPFYDPNTEVYFWAETPNEMAALHEFDLAQQRPVLDARSMGVPLVQEFLPKWIDDPALLARLRARVLLGESIPLSGEFDVLPSLGQWWRRHSVGEAIDRIRNGTMHMLGRNFIHRNGYGRHLAAWLSLALVAVLAALIARPRETARAAFAARFRSVLSFSISAESSCSMLVGAVSDRNRFFLTQFLPTLFSCGLLIRFGFQVLPWRWRLKIPWRSGPRVVEITPWRAAVAALWIFTRGMSRTSMRGGSNCRNSRNRGRHLSSCGRRQPRPHLSFRCSPH